LHIYASNQNLYFCNKYPQRGKNLMNNQPVTIILGSNTDSYKNYGGMGGGFTPIQLNGGEHSVFTCYHEIDLEGLKNFISQHSNRRIVGYVGYDVGFTLLKVPQAPSRPSPNLPLIWLMATEDEVINPSAPTPGSESEVPPAIELHQKVSKSTYIQQVSALKNHIQQGDIYEINYCIPFVAHEIELDASLIWDRLQQISPMPFAAFINHPDFAIISASPERFIKKQGNQICIQPMKGTRARGKNPVEDNQLKEELKADIKERAENVMIVDLTRNDLSKIASKGTVEVNELFGVYTFPNVHQMISTVTCNLKPGLDFTDILQATFPMGSMTGAPKKRAVELIEAYEDFSRGVFSGMLGFIEPGGDFDFNVMIRTIFYDKINKKIWVAVGSAITSQSDVEKEYEECLIKLQPLLAALNATIVPWKT
jgi:para-aminobenzoate synthetase component 1